MALTDVEEKATSLLSQGGMEAPATVGPSEPEPVQVAGLGSVSSRLSAKAARAMFGKGGGIMEKSRQKARDIQNQPAVKEQPETDDLGNIILPEEESVPVAPAIKEPPAKEKIVEEVEASPVPETPERFIRADPYDNYIKVGDEDIDFVMTAPERRDELLGSGMTDFNAANLPDENGIQERMEQISKMYPKEISESRRKKVTFAAARQVADLVGANPKKLRAVAEAVLNRRRGEGINVEGMGMMEAMLAARDLVVSEVRKLDGLAKSALSGEPVDLATFRHQMEFVANLQRQVKGAKTEYARTLSGMRITARAGSTNPHIAQNAAAKTDMDLLDMLDGFGGAESVQEMAKLYLSLNDPAARSRFARGLGLTRKIGNAMYEVWQHALLTNPISQTKNIVSGIWTTFMAPNLELGGAVAIGAVRRGLTDATDTAKLSDLQAQMFGQIVAIREAIIGSGKAFMQGSMPSKIEGSEAGALGGAEGTRRIPAFSGEAFGQEGVIGTGLDVLGNIATAGRVAYRTLEAGDTFFKVVARRGELYKNAMVEGQARGKQGEDLIDYIAEYIADPPAEIINKMDLQAKYVTLQTELDEVGKAINKIAKLPILRYFVPFVKTPYDAAKYSFIDRTPLGVAWGSTGAMMRAGGAQRDEAISRIALGTTIGMAAATMVYTGDISGGGPSNRSLRQARVSQGWQPYSIKVGGRWHSYAGFEPLSSIIGVWADAVEILSSTEWDDDDLTPQDVVGAAIAATMYNASNKTFMQGFATMAQVIQDPDRYTGPMMDKFGKSFVPRVFGNIKRTGVNIPWIEQSVIEPDPVIRDAQNFMQDVKAQIPSLSATLKPSVDRWGRDKVRGVVGADGKRNLALGPDLLSPVYMRDEKKNIVDEETIRLGGVYLRNDSPDLNVDELREPITLTDDMRYFRNQMRGKIGFEQLKQFIASDQYQDLIKMSEAARTSGKRNEKLDELMKNKIRSVYLDALELADRELVAHPVYGPPLQNLIEAMARDQSTADGIGIR